MCLCDVVDKLHNEHCLAHACSTEQPYLATSLVIDNLDARLEDRLTDTAV